MPAPSTRRWAPARCPALPPRRRRRCPASIAMPGGSTTTSWRWPGGGRPDRLGGRLQRLVEIGDQVVDRLDADRQADHVRPGAGGEALLVAELAGGGRCRVQDQAAGIADVGGGGEQLA